MESDLNSLKQNVQQETTHSDMIEKATLKYSNDLKQQIYSIKEAITRLTDVMAEEFEVLRTEYRQEDQLNYSVVIERMEKLEIA